MIRKASTAAWSEFQIQTQQLASSPVQRKFVIGGNERYVGTLYSVAPETLDRFHSSAEKQLDILGHSLTGLFEQISGRNSISRALVNGATVRVVFLDPTTPNTNQLAQVSRAIKTDLISKINRSIDTAIAFKDTLRTHLRRVNPSIKDAEAREAQGRLQLAASGLISYANIQRADDTILVSHYSQSEGLG